MRDKPTVRESPHVEWPLTEDERAADDGIPMVNSLSAMARPWRVDFVPVQSPSRRRSLQRLILS